MFSAFSNLSNYVSNASSTITQSETIQNVKDKVVSIPTQTKEYFYPKPEYHEMKSMVRLDTAFFVQSDIENYATPGQQQQQSIANHIESNIINTPVKPSGNASDIISWHNFDLCVEDESLFDDTETGSYTTTNYSVTTANTYKSSIISPQYNINGNILKQKSLDMHNLANPQIPNYSSKDTQNSKEEEDDYINLNENNAEKLFQSIHKFRKSFIAKRKASGIHDVGASYFSAPPTSKSDGSYHRRLHTLDLDPDDVNSLELDNENIAPPHGTNEKVENGKGHKIGHSVEGSRDFGVDDIDIINGYKSDSNKDENASNDSNDIHDDDENKKGNIEDLDHLRSESVKWRMSRDRESSKIYVSGLNEADNDNIDTGDVGHINEHSDNGNDNDNEHNSDNDDDGSVIDECDFMKLQNHFSVERKLNGPRGSMKVTRISVSDELRETFIHQKNISQAQTEENIGNESEDEDAESSFDGSELDEYVKKVSLTPRGLDPDNAKVSVVESKDDMLHYDEREYLKANNLLNNEHKRNDSMDTQPDNNDQAPYLSQKQLSGVIKADNLYDDEAQSTDNENENEQIPNMVKQKTMLVKQPSEQFYEHNHVYGAIAINQKEQDENEDNERDEGWQKPTGYDHINSTDNESEDSNDDLLAKISPKSIQNNKNNMLNHSHSDDEKFTEEEPPNGHGQQYVDGSGHVTTQTGPSMMTMGDNMLNVLRYIPWNENDHLVQELDESFNERKTPRFEINESLNEIIRFHWNGDALLKSDILVIPITEEWTPISQISHMLMNSAGPSYLEWIHSKKQNKEYIATGDAQHCNAYNLPTKYIIHTTPPKYDDRYPVASENAIHSCYWRSLEIAADLKCKSIVFPIIYPPKLFSEQLAIHIMARTLRRFLERYFESVSFECVVICVENEQQMQLYTRIFTIYFPRDDIDLKYSEKYMPAYTGNNSGGTVVKLRKHNVELSPLQNVPHREIKNEQQHAQVVRVLNSNRIDYETYDIYGNLRPAIQSMVEYKDEPETVWKAQELKKWQWQKNEESFGIKYKRYWNRSRKTNLQHIEMFQFVYIGGQDDDGRDIVVFVGNRFPFKHLMQQKKLKESLLHIIKELHHIVSREYIIIYLHSYVNEEENLPPISWINQCFHVCSQQFEPNLYKFFVIHPNFRLKSWFYMFSTKAFYKKIVYLDSITKLEHNQIDLERIALPGKSWEYEREMFGEDKLADKMALATDDLVLDALPYR